MANIKRLAADGEARGRRHRFKNASHYEGLFVFNVKTVKEAEALLVTDPAVAAGRFSYEAYNWYGSARHDGSHLHPQPHRQGRSLNAGVLPIPLDPRRCEEPLRRAPGADGDKGPERAVVARSHSVSLCDEAIAAMKIAFVTQGSHPEIEDDDRPLAAALARRGALVLSASWDDEDFAWDKVDLVLLRSPWDYCRRYAEFLRLARARGGADARRSMIPAPSAGTSKKRYLPRTRGEGRPHRAHRVRAPGREGHASRALFSSRPGTPSCSSLRFPPTRGKRSGSHPKNMGKGKRISIATVLIARSWSNPS